MLYQLSYHFLLSSPKLCWLCTFVYANAARRDAGFFNVFYCVHTFCGLSGWGGWGDVNVPWKRYVTYAGVGVGGGGVMLTFLGSGT